MSVTQTACSVLWVIKHSAPFVSLLPKKLLLKIDFIYCSHNVEIQLNVSQEWSGQINFIRKNILHLFFPIDSE